MGIASVPTSRTPSMSSLLQKAWKAKRLKSNKGLATSSQAMWPKMKLQTVPNPEEKPKYSPLLSRRFGKTVLMTIEVPPRQPFPPPLEWNSPPPPHSPARLYARPFARPRARHHPCKRPERSMRQQNACAGH